MQQWGCTCEKLWVRCASASFHPAIAFTQMPVFCPFSMGIRPLKSIAVSQLSNSSKAHLIRYIGTIMVRLENSVSFSFQSALHFPTGKCRGRKIDFILSKILNLRCYKLFYSFSVVHKCLAAVQPKPTRAIFCCTPHFQRYLSTLARISTQCTQIVSHTGNWDLCSIKFIKS